MRLAESDTVNFSPNPVAHVVDGMSCSYQGAMYDLTSNSLPESEADLRHSVPGSQEPIGIDPWLTMRGGPPTS